jgi:hypothetical protein
MLGTAKLRIRIRALEACSALSKHANDLARLMSLPAHAFLDLETTFASETSRSNSPGVVTV